MSEFDQYSQDYLAHVDKAVRISGKSATFFHKLKARLLIDAFRSYQPIDGATVLDVGCGTGSLSCHIAPRVGHLTGVDISKQSIETARERIPQAEFMPYDGKRLPFPDNTFDLVFASCVMHHVPPAEWESLLSEMRRVACQGKFVSIIEHNPWNPLTRLAVSQCEFDADAVLLTRARVKRLCKQQSMTLVDTPYILFFPWDVAVLRRLERVLSPFPLGAQHLVLAQK